MPDITIGSSLGSQVRLKLTPGIKIFLLIATSLNSPSINVLTLIEEVDRVYAEKFPDCYLDNGVITYPEDRTTKAQNHT